MRAWMALVLLAVAALAPSPAAAQPSPLEARVILDNPPPDATYHATNPATPIVLKLQVLNTSGASVNTTEGFSRTEFWRRLYFTSAQGAIITNAPAEHGHREATSLGFCQYRLGVPQHPAIPVVPVEVLAGPPAPFTLEFMVDDARRFFDLSRPGTYRVQARIPVLVFTGGGDLLTDCDQFPSVTVANVGQNALARQELLITSNVVEFTILSDGEPPTTTIARSPPPNAAGWNNTDVTLTLSAVDNEGGSGVRRIVATATGAQSGEQVFTGTTGAFVVTAQGTTDVAVHAEDNAGNVEADQVAIVRIDRTAPAVAPPGAITVIATAVDGTATGATAPALATFLAGGTATDALDPAPQRLDPAVAGVPVTNTTPFPLGARSVTFRFQDVADNIGTAASTVTVVPGTPRIEGTLVAKGVEGASRWYDIRLRNIGNGIARDVRVNTLSFRTLSGFGTVTRDTRTTLPISAGDLAVGASTVIRLYLVVPATVTRFSITENGQMRNVAATSLSFSLSQSTTP